MVQHGLGTRTNGSSISNDAASDHTDESIGALAIEEQRKLGERYSSELTPWALYQIEREHGKEIALQVALLIDDYTKAIQHLLSSFESHELELARHLEAVHTAVNAANHIVAYSIKHSSPSLTVGSSTSKNMDNGDVTTQDTGTVILSSDSKPEEVDDPIILASLDIIRATTEDLRKFTLKDDLYHIVSEQQMSDAMTLNQRIDGIGYAVASSVNQIALLSHQPEFILENVERLLNTSLERVRQFVFSRIQNGNKHVVIAQRESLVA